MIWWSHCCLFFNNENPNSWKDDLNIETGPRFLEWTAVILLKREDSFTDNPIWLPKRPTIFQLIVAWWHDTLSIGPMPEPWWRHQMETFFALLALCVRNSPVTGEFLTQRPVTWSFDVFFDLRPNKRLSKQSWDWWFEMPSRSLWRHCNADKNTDAYVTWSQ